MKSHAQTSFQGSIKYLSLSPHVDPEGIVLDDGTFVKAPPHSLVNANLFRIGAKVSGEAELLGEHPNRVLHHARIESGKQVMADDSLSKGEREKLKEKHKADLETREDAKDEPLTLRGKIVALATKPKGEVDRLILEDGTSVHVPKDIELAGEDCELGSTVEVKGKSRRYGEGRFLKASAIKIL